MMNEKRRAHIIGECIEKVQTGRKSRSDCVRKYPQLADELHFAFYSLDVISTTSFSEVDPIYQRKRKIRLMQKLADRENSVTKHIDHRYRLQNLKRRFDMTWVIIVATILSLISGTGVVYASNDALPGDMIYPVKTWVENIQLAIAPEDVDTGLHLRFADHLVEEAIELILGGRFEDLDEVVDGYQKRTELLTLTMARLQTEDPEEAVKLRMELKEKLQEQARLMEVYLEDGEEGDHHLQEQIQKMLETNTELRLRIHEDDNQLEIAVENTGEEMGMSLGESESAGIGTEDTQGKKGDGNPSFEIDNEEGTLMFGLGGKGENGVYAEIDGTQFGCTVEGDTAICNINSVPQKGNVNLYDKKTNQLLFSYAYEYAWEWEKNDQENNSEHMEDGDSGMETNKKNKDHH
jgi:hypothetical protein